MFLPTALWPLARGIGVSICHIEPLKQHCEDPNDDFHAAPHDGPSLSFSQSEMPVFVDWVTRPTDEMISPAYELGYDPICVARLAAHHTPLRALRHAHVQTQNGA